jgi:hypothetical protein
MYIYERKLSGSQPRSKEQPITSWPAPRNSYYPLSEATVERVLEFVTKWGRNASPFNIANTYWKLNKKGIEYWRDVSKAAKAGRALLTRIDGLERGARAFKKAADELSSAESKLPSYPLQSAAKAGHSMVSKAELDYVEKYFNTAAMIANDAWAVRSELEKAISGWDAALAQANSTRDFTRQAVWEAIAHLDLRFSNEGGSFRAYLVNARDAAARTESWARMKQYHGAHILDKWTPAWYKPPTPSDQSSLHLSVRDSHNG